MLTCSHGQVPAELLLDFHALLAPGIAASTCSGTGGAYRRPANAGAALDAASLFRFHTEQLAAPVDLPALLARLGAPGSPLLRAKGTVLGDDGLVWLVQVVGRRVCAVPLPGPAGPGLGRLACTSLSDKAPA